MPSQRAGFCTGRTGAGAVRRVQQQAGGDGYAERAVRGVASAGVVGRRALLGLGGDRTVFWTSCVSAIGEDQAGTDDGTIGSQNDPQTRAAFWRASEVAAFSRLWSFVFVK